MKRSVLACALALACALSLAAPALAAEKAPSLAGDSKTTAVAKVYEYDPHRYLANGNSVYGNTLTVAADERVYDDSGKLWPGHRFLRLLTTPPPSAARSRRPPTR